MGYALPLTGPSPDQADVDAVRNMLDEMDQLDNDQRARFLLTSEWMRDCGAAASERIRIPRPRESGERLDPRS